MALIKNDVVERVADGTGFAKKDGVEVVECLLGIIKGSLERGEDVLVSGFGKFCVREKNERKGRNPATSEDLMLGPRKVVTFKCSGKLREKINGGRYGKLKAEPERLCLYLKLMRRCTV